MINAKPLVLVTGPVTTRSGYGNHARDICQALIESDKYDVRINKCRWGNTPMNALEKGNPVHEAISQRFLNGPNIERQPDLHLHVVVPNEFQPIGKKNIGVTAGIEHTIPPAYWIDGVNRMDMTICTSEFTKSSFETIQFDKVDKKTNQPIGKVKVEKPLETLFEGADPNLYKETNEFSTELVESFSEVKEDFCFLFVGHWLSGNMGEDRKDISMLIKVFIETFKHFDEMPALILKTSGATFSIIDREEILKKINEVKKSIAGDKFPSVYFIHGDFTDEEMNQLYNQPKVKAHITFTHGEGFGRPLLEATFSGKPVIAPFWSGQVDFLDANYSVELPTVLTKVPASAFPKEYGNPEAEWATVNYSIASQIMKDVFNNYKKYELRGKKQMIVNRENFTHGAMKDKLVSIVDSMLTNIPQQVKLKLPELNKKSEKVSKGKISLPKLKREV